MDLFPQFFIADINGIGPLSGLSLSGLKINGLSVFLCHKPLQTSDDAWAVSDGIVNGIGKYNAQAAVSAGLHHRIPEAGTDGHSHLADNIPPFVPDQIQIL